MDFCISEWRKTKYKEPAPHNHVFSGKPYLYLLYSHHFSVSRFVSLPATQPTYSLCAIVYVAYSTISLYPAARMKGQQHFLNHVHSVDAFSLFFWKISEGSLVWSWIKNGACAWLTMQWSVHRGYRHYLKMNETRRTRSSLGICCQSHSLTLSRSIFFSFARFDSWLRFRAVEI